MIETVVQHTYCPVTQPQAMSETSNWQPIALTTELTGRLICNGDGYLEH